MNRDQAASILETRGINEPSGSLIEILASSSPTQREIDIFERFLSSDCLGNRETALQALVFSGGRNGYEVEALLNFIFGIRQSTAADVSAIGCLALMAARGSPKARRALISLSSDEDWLRDYGDVVIGHVAGLAYLPEDLSAASARVSDGPTRERFLAFLSEL